MIEIICRHCGRKHDFEDNHITPHIVGSDERQMGTEFAYTGILTENCVGCKSKLRVEFNIWEYPKGELNYKEFETQNCDLVGEPDYKGYFKEFNEPATEYVEAVLMLDWLVALNIQHYKPLKIADYNPSASHFYLEGSPERFTSIEMIKIYHKDADAELLKRWEYAMTDNAAWKLKYKK